MTIRTRPDRVIGYVWEVLSAEVARQCVAEWQAWRDDGHGDRRGACERMAVLVDLGRQQAAIALERCTGQPARQWSPAKNRRELSDMLDHATEDNPEALDPATITRCRVEVERPYSEYTTRERITR